MLIIETSESVTQCNFTTDHNAILFHSDKDAIFPILYREISLAILKTALSKLVLAYLANCFFWLYIFYIFLRIAWLQPTMAGGRLTRVKPPVYRWMDINLNFVIYLFIFFKLCPFEQESRLMKETVFNPRFQTPVFKSVTLVEKFSCAGVCF